MRVLRDSQIITEYQPTKTHVGGTKKLLPTEPLLEALRAADADGRTLSLREMCDRAGVSSTSVASALLHRLADAGMVVLGEHATCRSYRLTPQGKGKLDRVTELEGVLRQIRRWIESEPTTGEQTMRIYLLAGEALP